MFYVAKFFEALGVADVGLRDLCGHRPTRVDGRGNRANFNRRLGIFSLGRTLENK